MIDVELLNALRRLCQTETLLIASDFDGTMAPLVLRADDARAEPRSVAAFAALTELPQTKTALISGRALASLRLVAQPDPRTLLVGSHGAETWFGPQTEPLQLSEEQSALVQETVAILQQISAQYSSTTVEIKPAGAVLHTRQASNDVAQAAVAAATEALQPLGLHLHEGKRVLEAAVLKVNKGQGLELLRSVSGASGVFFAGDDRTDEDGFAVLHGVDVGVKVGAGESSAAFRINSVEDTAELLEAVLNFRKAALHAGL